MMSRAGMTLKTQAKLTSRDIKPAGTANQPVLTSTTAAIRSGTLTGTISEAPTWRLTCELEPDPQADIRHRVQLEPRARSIYQSNESSPWRGVEPTGVELRITMAAETRTISTITTAPINDGIVPQLSDRIPIRTAGDWAQEHDQFKINAFNDESASVSTKLTMSLSSVTNNSAGQWNITATSFDSHLIDILWPGTYDATNHEMVATILRNQTEQTLLSWINNFTRVPIVTGGVGMKGAIPFDITLEPGRSLFESIDESLAESNHRLTAAMNGQVGIESKSAAAIAPEIALPAPLEWSITVDRADPRYAASALVNGHSDTGEQSIQVFQRIIFGTKMAGISQNSLANLETNGKIFVASADDRGATCTAIFPFLSLRGINPLGRLVNFKIVEDPVALRAYPRRTTEIGYTLAEKLPHLSNSQIVSGEVIRTRLNLATGLIELTIEI